LGDFVLDFNNAGIVIPLEQMASRWPSAADQKHRWLGKDGCNSFAGKKLKKAKTDE
jgi:hypothetical protein